MCNGCWAEMGSHQIVNEKTLKVADLIDDIYGVRCCGGNLHTVLDDFNIKDENLQWSLEHLKYQENDTEYPTMDVERECLRMLIDMTMEERVSAIGIAHGYFSVPK